MKKTILSLALLAGLSSAAQAQTGLKLGLKGGFNGSTFSGSNSKGSEYKAGFAAGGLLNYGFTDKFSVQGELLYSQKGASQDGVSYVSGTSATGLPTISNETYTAEGPLSYWSADAHCSTLLAQAVTLGRTAPTTIMEFCTSPRKLE